METKSNKPPIPITIPVPKDIDDVPDDLPITITGTIELTFSDDIIIDDTIPDDDLTDGVLPDVIVSDDTTPVDVIANYIVSDDTIPDDPIPVPDILKQHKMTIQHCQLL